MRSGIYVTFTLLTLTSCAGDSTTEQLSSVSQGARVRGAIFTTLPDGSAVNHNIYQAKEDVYLDGGPQGGSPSSAGALDEGDYYFQVTDPSGKTLLSQDDISCREIHVSDDGVITAVGAAGCSHLTGSDVDYSSLGAITVQLMPYADTPNPGGEYKVWVTPIDDYVAGGGRSYGFVDSDSKTDNFKVHVVVVQPPPPTPYCGDGHLDSGELCDDGNNVSGDGCDANCNIEIQPPPPPPCVCGDGHLDSGEQCDDGNTANGDGCSSTCQTEVPPPPPPCCGNGVIESGETCDDGNTTGGDGCSSTCQSEEGGGWPQPEPPDGSSCRDCTLMVNSSSDGVFVY
jgi:cysteine-rich repeat protein